MRGFEKQSFLAEYLKPNLAVVEVRKGESQEEAWRRHLAVNPQATSAHIKIFHYPRPGS